MADADADELAPPDPAPVAGPGIIRASWIGTALLSVTAILAAIAPTTFIAVSVGVAMVMFFVGIGLFFWAYAVAVARSRTDLIGMGGLFFLAGSAPRSVQRSLLGSLIVEIVVALATAGVHPFTPLAFGVLAPMYGLALCGLWAARHGTFPPRPPDEKRPRRSKDDGSPAGASKAATGSATTGKAKPSPATSKRTTPPGTRSGGKRTRR